MTVQVRHWCTVALITTCLTACDADESDKSGTSGTGGIGADMNTGGSPNIDDLSSTGGVSDIGETTNGGDASESDADVAAITGGHPTAGGATASNGGVRGSANNADDGSADSVDGGHIAGSGGVDGGHIAGSGGVDASIGTGGDGGTAGSGEETSIWRDCDRDRPGWTLVWGDEFDYDGLPDPSRWGYEVGGNGWGNGEAQFYTDGRIENASVDQATGVLTITARREQWEGNAYTSAKLNSSLGTSNPGSWIGARIEIRARLPAGRGTWPAFWMMPDNCLEGWPNCGEIDIMEHVGYDENKIHGTIHTDAFNHVEGTQIGNSLVVPGVTSDFHLYILEWSADRLQWRVDDDVYQTVDRQPGWGFAEWPFNDKPFHIKINIAVGGSWGGAQGIDETIFPTTMDIDYVCVYQPEG